jgi:hypothetical protein
MTARKFTIETSDFDYHSLKLSNNSLTKVVRKSSNSNELIIIPLRVENYLTMTTFNPLERNLFRVTSFD